MSGANYYNPQAFVAPYNVASTAELPNVAGAAIQDPSLTTGTLATVAGGTIYYCTDATYGAGAWSVCPVLAIPFDLAAASDVTAEIAAAIATLTAKIAGGQTWAPTHVTTNSVLSLASDYIAIDSGLFCGLGLPSVAAVQVLQVLAPGSSIVPNGYPTSTQSINGVANEIVALTNGGTYFLTSDGAGATAAWSLINVSTLPLWNFAATAAPTVNDDTLDGYAPGSLWVNVTTDLAYICLDATAAAAVWKLITPPKSNSETADPTVNDDTTLGYSVNSVWTNTDSDTVFICTDATDGAAVWRFASSPTRLTKNNFEAIIGPTVNDDSTLGYSSGSQWVDTVGEDAYVCITAGAGAANWKQTTP